MVIGVHALSGLTLDEQLRHYDLQFHHPDLENYLSSLALVQKFQYQEMKTKYFLSSLGLTFKVYLQAEEIN